MYSDPKRHLEISAYKNYVWMSLHSILNTFWAIFVSYQSNHMCSSPL